MKMTLSSEWMVVMVLLTARFAPVFMFANPFTSMSMPSTVKVALVLTLAAVFAPLAVVTPELAQFNAGRVVVGIAGEVVLGAAIAFALQSAFGAFYMSGRILDMQAGFSMATVIDPSSKAQTPLVGSMFVLAAGAVFFAANGHVDLVRLFATTLTTVPVGTLATGLEPELFIAQSASMFLMGVAGAGASMAVLFLVDVALAVLSRTLPQMNVLMLSLQVKTVVLLLVLSLATGLMAPLVLRSIESGFRFIQKAIS